MPQVRASCCVFSRLLARVRTTELRIAVVWACSLDQEWCSAQFWIESQYPNDPRWFPECFREHMTQDRAPMFHSCRDSVLRKWVPVFAFWCFLIFRACWAQRRGALAVCFPQWQCPVPSHHQPHGSRCLPSLRCCVWKSSAQTHQHLCHGVCRRFSGSLFCWHFVLEWAVFWALPCRPRQGLAAARCCCKQCLPCGCGVHFGSGNTPLLHRALQKGSSDYSKAGDWILRGRVAAGQAVQWTA